VKGEMLSVHAYKRWGAELCIDAVHASHKKWIVWVGFPHVELTYSGVELRADTVGSCRKLWATSRSHLHHDLRATRTKDLVFFLDKRQLVPDFKLIKPLGSKQDSNYTAVAYNLANKATIT
jgi:hypothetical protein